ncbi:MAG: helix-turn-helix transcriptional regulator [Gammaproteobacteria bacterium]|nr:helix-turn-helix transcriptional regulator [Gammaproteobacteria bacterium]
MGLPSDPQPVPRRPARPRGRGRPTPDEASRLSAHLIEVAATLFEQEGFSAVSMNRIAASAGIGKDTLYARYPNKEALFLAVFSRQTEQHLGNCPSLAGTDTPCETALRRYGEWLLRSACTPGGLSRWLIFYREAQRFPAWRGCSRRPTGGCSSRGSGRSSPRGRPGAITPGSGRSGSRGCSATRCCRGC